MPVKYRHKYECFFSNILKLKSVTASKPLQITSSYKINQQYQKTLCLKNEAFDIWWYRVKDSSWTKFKQPIYIVSWYHYVVKLAITSARIETCWCWWWRRLLFPSSFSSVIWWSIITYSSDKLVFNTLAITLNVLLKAILITHGMNIEIICQYKGHGAMHYLYKQLQTVKM